MRYFFCSRATVKNCKENFHCARIIQVVNRLQMPMQFYIFMNETKEIEVRQKFLSSAKYHNKYSALDIFIIYTYCVYLDLCNLKFPENAYALA